ncbi:MAG: tRNA preQ1(34) S-adenosylmethionine ribosyltransferase-isomerase QueA [Treponemataceae bacterium]|nr:MAG: tRNA preQ1(34) S-adenosylmethionine ribosyltransferase-isomerase QueA [Treponemataceae bacterium]
MNTSEFYFDLPQELIAQSPSEKRGEDRLLVLDRATGGITHAMFSDIVPLIPANSLLVFNDSRVRKARVHGMNSKTGRVSEFLFIDRLDTVDTTDTGGKRWKAIVKNKKKHKDGMIFRFGGASWDVEGHIVHNEALANTEFLELRFAQSLDENWFEQNGHVPLPPYIKRADTGLDGERYQNVYAKVTGSAACPTAGLHFTPELLENLATRGDVETAFVTLHVGLGTFLPVRTAAVEEHVMHTETYTISAENAAKINAAKRSGKKIIAVGTTSLRTLEAAFLAAAARDADREIVQAGTAQTNIFIYRQNQFHLVDALITNFHTPESTLLMLVCAFAGRDAVFAAYAEAIQKRYRFFSYGEAMFITCS